MKEIRHGCECVGCAPGHCGRERAPVCFRVRRKDTELLVCSRCDVSSDEIRECLLDAETPLAAFIEYDPRQLTLDRIWAMSGRTGESPIHEGEAMKEVLTLFSQFKALAKSGKR